MMGILRTYSMIWIVTCLFLISGNSVMADRGMVSPQPGRLSQESQRAIILHNSEEEVLILGTELRADKNTGILEFIPFPSKPTVKLAAGDPFKAIERLVHKKGLLFISREVSKSGRTLVPIEIKLSEQIGLHDVTVIKINELSDFTQWVRAFFRKKGIKVTNDLSHFYETAKEYVDRGIHYFVFDYVSLKTETQSIEPLIYRFKTHKMYYPLKTSNAVGGKGLVELIVVSPGSLPSAKINSPFARSRHLYVPHFKLSGSPEIGFGLSNSKRVYPEEIEIMYPQANGFFSKTKTLYIQVMRYVGAYEFQDDIFIEMSKLDPRAYAWVKEGGPNLWEIRHYLRPVDSDKIRDTE
jgi:hypothetical protein